MDAGEAANGTGERILSVDILREFDMFWIVGGQWCVIWLLDLLPLPGRYELMGQFFRVPWEGLHFMDLVFPLFLFLVGVSAAFSLDSLVTRQGQGKAYLRVVRRTAVLFVLGLALYGGLASGWKTVRLLGVLQRIALCYLFTGIAVIHLRCRWILLLAATLLGGYAALLLFVPPPGQPHVTFAVGGNWAHAVDRLYLPGRPAAGTWDPEGLLGTVAAIASCLLGVPAGRLLRNPQVSPWRRVAWLLSAGVVALIAGYAWGRWLPIIKLMWTPSYVLVTTGYSAILLGIFYALIDIRRWRWWIAPFLWLGTNAIAIYVLDHLVSFTDLTSRLTGNDGIALGLHGSIGKVVVALLTMAMVLTLVRFLYRRKIFLRV